MSKTKFFSLIEQDFIPVLLDFGFTGQSLNWKRVREPFIDCVDIQIRSDNAACCVNLGEHLTIFPVADNSTATDFKNISSVDCEIKSRLAYRGESEHWWYFENALEEVSDLINCFMSESGVFFDKYRNFPSLFADVKIHDIGSDVVINLLPMMTKVRRILFMARVHNYLGDGKEAIEWAEFGIKNAGMAVGPKAAFREIIRAYK